MTHYARVLDGRVAEVLSVEGDASEHFHSEIVATLHELPDGSPVRAGWTYDGTEFHEPVPVVEPKPTTMSPLAFQARFHQDELTGIAQAAMSSPAVFLYMLQSAAAQVVDLSDPRTIAGVQALSAAHLLTSARATEILTP